MSFYDDASLIMFPSGYKEDKIYSLKPTDGSGDLTFTRASTATRVNSDGLIETSPVNLLTYSQEFDNADWLKLEVTISANTLDTIDPFGNNNADKIIDNAVNDGHFVYRSGWNTNEQTASFYAKSGTYSKICVVNASTGYGVFANLSTGTVFVSSGFTGTIESVSNGWYKITATHLAASAQTFAIGFFTGTNNISFSGTGSFAYIFGAQLNIGATAKPYFPTTDRLNVPRIDYTGGNCGKLLLEPQRTNLVTYSEQFNNAAWDIEQTSITANTATSPDGTQDADSMVENTANNHHLIYQGGALSAGSYSASVFIKKNTRQYAFLQIATDSAVNRYSIVIDLNNGNMTASSTAGSPSGTSYKIDSMGNGWYRVAVTATHTAGAVYIIWGLSNSATPTFNSVALPTYTGDGTSNIYIWGAQLEAGSYATSYIPTLASSVTRLADAALKTGISSLIGQTQGTLFADIDVINLNPSNVSRIILSDGTTNNYIFLGINEAGSGNLSRLFINNFSTSFSLSLFSSTAITIGLHKLALAYKSGEFALYLDGNSVASSSATGTIPATSQIVIGGTSPSTISNLETLVLNKSILFPTRLTNAELATLTTI